MPSRALAISPGVAQLLRDRRQALGLTLRAVAEMSGEHGELIPHSTLARIEMGRLDPGITRLQQLLDLYQLPMSAAGEILALEAIAGPTPIERDPVKLRARALTAWREGRVPDAIASFFAFRRRVPNDAAHRGMRHDAILAFAVTVSSLGKSHLARHMLDELLMETPEPSLVVQILIQQSVLWRHLGSSIAAIAFLEEARRRSDGSPTQLGWIEHQRGVIHLDEREFAAAETSLKAALRLYRRGKHGNDVPFVLGALARLQNEAGRPRQAIKAALVAERAATKHRAYRTKSGAQIERARALLALGETEAARSLLRSILADTVEANDNVHAFHVHFHLWRAESALGNTQRAAVEQREARYYLKFVDGSLPEVGALRQEIERLAPPAPAKSSRRR